MDNEVISQAITLTLIGVGTAFVLLVVLMLTTKLMSFVLARFISRNLMVRGGGGYYPRKNSIEQQGVLRFATI